LLSATKNVTQTTCGAPVRDKSTEYRVLSITLGSISAAVVVLRLVSKYMISSTLAMDDYFITISLIAGIPSTVLNDRGLANNGLGKDIWAVPFDQITEFVHFFYLMEILYFVHVALLKLSLLFFYLRIFPGARIRQLIWGTIIFDVIFAIAFIFTGIFQCSPIDYYWTNWDGQHEGKCFDVNAMVWANAGISIVVDLWMLGLPISQLFALNLHWKKKIGVGMMFSVGTL
jgi:hypothetical protein